MKLTPCFMLASLLVLACSSAPPPPAAEPSLEEPSASAPEKGVPASNATVEKGMAAIEKQDFAGAKTILEQARKDDPKDAQAAFYLGVALQGLDDKAGAQKEYKAALELDPKLPDAAVNLSQLMLDDNDAKGALAVVDAALKNAPKHPDLLLNRALAVEGAGMKDEVLAAYGAAAAARPNDASVHVAYAELLSDADKGQEAAAELKKAMATDDPTLLAAIARLFGKEKAFSDCVAAIDKALAAKKSPDLLVRRGVCRHGMKDDKAAQADYEAALALDANFAPAHYYLGMHLGAKDKKKALEHLDKAASIAGGQGVGPAAKKEAAELRGKK